MSWSQKSVERLGLDMEDMYSSKPGVDGDYARICKDRQAARAKARAVHDEQVRLMLKAFE